MPALIKDNLLTFILAVFFALITSGFYLALDKIKLEMQAWTQEIISTKVPPPEVKLELSVNKEAVQRIDRVVERMDARLDNIEKEVTQMKNYVIEHMNRQRGYDNAIHPETMQSDFCEV